MRAPGTWQWTAVAVLTVVAACEQANELVAPNHEAMERRRGLDGLVVREKEEHGRFIVTVASNEDPRIVAAGHGVDPDLVYTNVLKGFSGEISDAARNGLLKDARVVSIDRDIEVQHQQTDNDQLGTPWGLDRIDQRAVPLDGLYKADLTGEGVTAYIVDSGIRHAHSEFEGRASYGFDVYSTAGEDCHGHGTHVAGTVGGKTFGVAKKVQLVSVKVLGCTGSGSVSLIISGLDWVASNASRPAVVNLSIASPVYDPLDRAVAALVRAGIPVIVAAANYNSDACNYSPAREASAMTVAASTQSDSRASYSNWGPCVDLFAPGSGILSADFANDLGAATKSGTSMAAPHVTGVAALFMQQNPAASAAQVQDALKAATTQGIVASANSANNHLLFSDPGSAPPPTETPTIELSGQARKDKKTRMIDLSWQGATGGMVVVKLNGTIVDTTANSGSYTYLVSSRSRSTYQFEICELEGSLRCSNTVSIGI